MWFSIMCLKGSKKVSALEDQEAALADAAQYSAMVVNLKYLLRTKPNFSFQYRILIGDPCNPHKRTMSVADSLVLASEDNLFFGIHKEVTVSGTHVYLEFKEKVAEFVPVDYSGMKTSPIGNTPPRPARGGILFDEELHGSSVPEEVQVNSPHPGGFAHQEDEEDEDSEYDSTNDSSDDDDSTISSKESADDMDVDDSVTSSSSKDKCLDENGQCSEELLMKALLQEHQAKRNKKAHHHRKKARTPDGSFDDDSKTTITRGSDREGKRKKAKQPESQADAVLDGATQKSSKSKRSAASKKTHKSTKGMKPNKKHD